MKQRILIFLSIVVFGSMALSAQESSKSQSEELFESVIVTIEGMACQEGCADAISANLKKVSGVKGAEVSFATGQANIDFDANEVSINALKAVITNTKVKDYVYTIKKVEPIKGN